MTTSALFNQIDLLSMHSNGIKLLRFWRNFSSRFFFIAASGLVESNKYDMNVYRSLFRTYLEFFMAFLRIQLSLRDILWRMNI